MVKASFIALLVILLDQATKHLAGQYTTVYYNSGISFGLVAVVPQYISILLLLTVISLIWFKLKDVWVNHQIITGIFFGAALSNIVDRAIFAGVRDWLPIPFSSLYNNIADWLLCLAIIVILLLNKAQKKDVT